MDLFEYINHQMAGMRRHITTIMSNVTPEQFNWAPPGTANTISATFIHLTSVEDNFIQNVLQGKPRVWDTGDWCAKTGVKKTPSIGESWDEFRHANLALEPMFEYQKAVWAATDAYLARLTAEELDRIVKFAGREWIAADVLLLAVSQALSHAGEIAALKGAQGAKGLAI